MLKLFRLDFYNFIYRFTIIKFINIIRFIHRDNAYRFNLSSDDSPSDRFHPQPSSSNAPEDFYIWLRQKMARASFVERVNIPRISFRIVSLQVIAIETRQSILRLPQRDASCTYTVWLHTCMRGRGMDASHVCAVCAYICTYTYVCTSVDRERVRGREHMRPGPQLSMPRANIYAVAINQFGCLW